MVMLLIFVNKILQCLVIKQSPTCSIIAHVFTCSRLYHHGEMKTFYIGFTSLMDVSSCKLWWIMCYVLQWPHFGTLLGIFCPPNIYCDIYPQCKYFMAMTIIWWHVSTMISLLWPWSHIFSHGFVVCCVGNHNPFILYKVCVCLPQLCISYVFGCYLLQGFIHPPILCSLTLHILHPTIIFLHVH